MRILSLILVLFLTGSCALRYKKCKIETCKVRMLHSHAEVYKHMDMKEVRKKNEKLKREAEKEEAALAASNDDVNPETTDESITHTEDSHEAEVKENEEEEKKEKKKKKKKRKKTPKSRWFLPAHPVTNPKFLGIIPKRNKETYAIGGEQGPKLKLWRSRVTPWWKNQNPKVGEQWKKPTDQ